MSDWQDIATAPYDREVDLWMVDWISGLQWREPDCQWDGTRWTTVDVDRGVEAVGLPGIQDPSHWREVPTPPALEVFSSKDGML